MCLLTQFDIRESRVQLAHGSFLHRNIASMGHKLNSFFQEAVFKLKYEDVNCKVKPGNLTRRYEKQVMVLAEQLNFKDGHSIFDANTQCNYWLTAFKTKFKDVKVGGSSFEDDAVDYAKRVFNDTQNHFGKNLKEKDPSFQAFRFAQGEQYHHAMVYGGLQEYMDPEAQCSLVKELLQIVMPGGNIFIGDYVEKNKVCPSTEKFVHHVTPSCFWEKKCLKGHGVAEICYIKEQDLFGDLSIDKCSLAVFIHKKVVVSEQRGGLADKHLVKHRCRPHPKMIQCSGNQSQFGSSINETIVSSMAGLPVRSISKALENFQKARRNAAQKLKKT